MTVNARLIDDLAGDPEALAAAVQIYADDIAVRDPGDPPPGPAEVLAEVLPRAPGQAGAVAVAGDGDQPIGLAWAIGESAPGDDHQAAFVEVLVDPGVRRQGVATALLRELVPALVDQGQHSIITYPCQEVAPEAATGLSAKLGLTFRMEERCSRARVADIDPELMGRWEGDAPQVAPGYRVEQWEGPCPDALAPAWQQAMASMEDMPTGELDLNLFTRSAADQRIVDERRREQGFRSYRSLVLAPGGDPAGLSEMMVHVERPQVAHQGDTGVLASHRGKRLGRWLKAANYRQVQAAHPELAVIETYNAEDNPWMLDINVAMGFRPHHRYRAYQGPIEGVLAALGYEGG